MSIFNLIIVLICSIFGAYFINKILEEITAQSKSKKQAIKKERTTEAVESAKDPMSSTENTPSNPPPDSVND